MPYPSVGIVIQSGTAPIFSVVCLITNEYIPKLKLNYTKLGDWMKMITLLYEKFLEQSMVDKQRDNKEADELNKLCNRYVNETSGFM